MVLVYYRPKLAMERGTKPDALGTRPYHCTNTLKAAIVKARRAWKDAQTRCHHLLEVADQRQHREHRLYQHTILPLPTLAQFEVRRIPLRGMEAGITQDDHASVDLPNQPLKRVIPQVQGVVAVCEDFLRRQVAGLCRPGDIRYDATSRTTCRKGASWR